MECDGWPVGARLIASVMFLTLSSAAIDPGASQATINHIIPQSTGYPRAGSNRKT